MAISCNTEIAINNYSMPETFIADPLMTDEELIKGINKDTRFVILDDHTNTEPTGGPLALEYISGGRVPIIDQLIRDRPNCIFIMENHRSSVADCDNVMWLPLCWIMFPATMTSQTCVPTDWQTPRPFTVNHVGGKNRINRILLEHWLAKNYSLDQLVYTKFEESELSMIEPIIRSSPSATKKHFRPKKNLPIKWFDTVQPEKSWIERRLATGIQKLIKELKLTSYLALQTESQDIALNTTIGEKTWLSMMGGNLVLQFGNYRINDIYKKLGLETFDNYFDHSHLESTDRYYQTIGGCENNRHLITNHEEIETVWFSNIPALLHNYKLARDINHWLHMFEREMRLLCDALVLTKNMDARQVITIPVDRFKHEFKL